MYDIAGKVIGLVLAFTLCVIAPVINVSVERQLLTEREVITLATDLLDEVVDSKQLTDQMLQGFAADLAAEGVAIDYEIIHMQRSVDPSADGYSVNYYKVANINKYNTGDKVGIHLKNISLTGTQQLASNLSSVFIPEFDYTFYERVR